MTVFAESDMKDIYANDLDKEITADKAWTIAGAITERYRNAGYFLSRALVPQQKIREGRIVIRVVEGYIGDIKFDHPLAENDIVKQSLSELRALRPLKADQIESILLTLNE